MSTVVPQSMVQPTKHELFSEKLHVYPVLAYLSWIFCQARECFPSANRPLLCIYPRLLKLVLCWNLNPKANIGFQVCHGTSAPAARLKGNGRTASLVLKHPNRSLISNHTANRERAEEEETTALLAVGQLLPSSHGVLSLRKHPCFACLPVGELPRT